MTYEFFFSYTRSNNDGYLKCLFDDLSEEIRLRRGLPIGAPVGFFDQQDIELGRDWDATIVDALQHCKVMLAVASPGYFKSDYCGKEWALFQRRCADHERLTGTRAPLLKTIVWVDFGLDALPAHLRALQLRSGDPQALHNIKGLRYLLKQIGTHRAAYNDYVEALVDEIIEASDAHKVEPLAGVPALAAVPSAFAPPPAAPGTIVLPQLAPSPSGPKHVQFIVVAASPLAFGAARPADPYFDAGAGEWKPFYPLDQRAVNPLLAQVASRNDLLFSVKEVPFDDDLVKHVDEAGAKRQIVVIVLDPWSLHWDAGQAVPAYQSALRQLDGKLDYHWCVLVPWNEHDIASNGDRDAIMKTVRDTFDRHATLSPNPLFYRDGIASADELQAILAEVLTRLKEEINKRALVQRPVPKGPPRPSVSGPSTGGQA